MRVTYSIEQTRRRIVAAGGKNHQQFEGTPMTDKTQEPEKVVGEVTREEVIELYREAARVGKEEKQSSAIAQAAKGLAAIGGFEKNSRELTDQPLTPEDTTPDADEAISKALGLPDADTTKR